MATPVQSTISQIQSAGAAAQQSATQSDPSALDKNAFLKLLTTQLQQQDPTQPMDSTAFVAQLAQFSTLEQMNNTNDTLTKMLAAQSTALQTTAANFVGKNAVFQSNEVTLTAGSPVTINATLPQPAANVNVVIQDQAGNQVRTIGLGSAPAGLTHITWDGLDGNGNQAESGQYTVQVQATDASGNPMTVTQSWSAPITGVSYDTSGTPTFLAGGISVPLSSISELDE